MERGSGTMTGSLSREEQVREKYHYHAITGCDSHNEMKWN